MILIIAFACLLTIVWRLWPSKRPNVIGKCVEDNVNNVLAHIAGVDPDDEDDCKTPLTPGRDPTRFQARLVMQAKAEFGFLQRSVANRLMVRKFLLGIMRDHGVRPQHISMHLDIVVAIFFIPSDADIAAHQVGATAAAHQRGDMMASVWESFYGVFGRMKDFGSA